MVGDNFYFTCISIFVAEHSPEAAAAVCSSQNDGEEQSPTTSNLHPTMEEEETTKAEAIVTDLVENVSAVERGEDQAEKAQKKEGDEQATKCTTAGDGIMIETSVDVNGDGASTSAKELTQPPKEPIHQYPLGIGAQNRNSMEPERQRQQVPFLSIWESLDWAEYNFANIFNSYQSDYADGRPYSYVRAADRTTHLSCTF
jgi:hypothetical protein